MYTYFSRANSGLGSKHWKKTWLFSQDDSECCQVSEIFSIQKRIKAFLSSPFHHLTKNQIIGDLTNLLFSKQLITLFKCCLETCFVISCNNHQVIFKATYPVYVLPLWVTGSGDGFAPGRDEITKSHQRFYSWESSLEEPNPPYSKWTHFSILARVQY